MKLIKPQALDAQKISSNASADGIAAWEPQGLDRLGSLTGIVAGIVDDFLYFTSYIGVSSGKNTIRRQDLSTGTISGTIASFDGDPVQLVVSPDGTKAALTRVNALGPGIEVFNLSTGAVLFKREANVESAGPIAWAPDSLSMVYTQRNVGADDGKPYHVAPLVDFLGTAYVRALLMEDSPDGRSTPRLYPIKAIDYLYATAVWLVGDIPRVGAADDNWGWQWQWTQPAGEPVVGDTFLGFGDLNFLLTNASRNELLMGFADGVRVYTLPIPDSFPPPVQTIPGNFVQGTRSQDGSEFYFQAGSTLPQHRRFAAADYTELDAFPATTAEQPVKQMLYGTDYAVFLRNNYPYQIVDRATNAAISQFNPDVKTGERYTFRDAIWEVLADNAEQPDIGAAANPATWLEVRKTNAVRMIDGKVGSVSTAAGPFVIDILPATAIDGLALFNVQASAITVDIIDPIQGLAYTTGRKSLADNSAIGNWHDYFYEPTGLQTDTVLTNLPRYQGATVRVTLQDVAGQAQLGELVVGSVFDIGDTVFGIRTGVLDFSRKERDEFGNFRVIERGFSKRADFPVSISARRVAGTQSLLAGLRATPAVYIGAENLPETLIYGFYRSFELVATGPRFSEFSLEVEGLT